MFASLYSFAAVADWRFGISQITHQLEMTRQVSRNCSGCVAVEKY